MTTKPVSLDPHRWADTHILPGESAEVAIEVGQSYSGYSVSIPVLVQRGLQDGPVISIIAAIHGDEINGTGAIRTWIFDESIVLQRGTLILVPVVNVLGFDRHSRYLPDRRDLNRCFPGNPNGTLASRMAHRVFLELVGRSDYAVDLHTAAKRRTNFPNVRADMRHPRVKEMAEVFGSEIILSSKGPEGSFRQEASSAGVPTIIVEAGEVSKVEPGIVEFAMFGIRNVLTWLGMIDGKIEKPPFQAVIEKSNWVRAENGGFLQFHVTPGEIVRPEQPLATSTSLLGKQRKILASPFHGIVLGMSTLPAIAPGDAVCHIGRFDTSHRRISRILRALPDDHMHGRLLDDLATSLLVVEPEEEEEEPSDSEATAIPEPIDDEPTTE